MVYQQDLKLFAPQKTKLKPLKIDFTSNKFKHKISYDYNFKQNLAKAIGVKTKPLVWDVTAGLAKDAFNIASLGSRVILIERNLIIAQLLKQALNNAKLDETIAPIINNMRLIVGESKLIMPTIKTKPDVIYLDPMFPENKNRRKPDREKQFLRAIVNDKNSDDLLLTSCRKYASKVVVKRSVKDNYLSGIKPSREISGKTTRYDIYQQ